MSAPRPSSARQLHGFTLIELVLVMVLLAILLAVAVPSVRGFLGGSRSRDAVNQIIAVSQWARAKAAAESKMYRLGFDGTSYQLMVQEGESFARVASDFGKRFTLPEGMRVEVVQARAASTAAEPGAVAFYPNGRTDAGVFRITDASGRVTLIACLAPTEPFRVLTAEEAARL